MIPKIIHYCWFSKDPLPSDAVRCIESWKKHMPNYQIRKWTLDDFDVNEVAFTKDALDQRKWAYLTDYVRHYALYNFGGVYMDSDVLVFKSFDPLLTENFISSVECHPGPQEAIELKKRIDSAYCRNSTEIKVPGIGVQAAVLCASPGHILNKKCMDFYKSITLAEVLEKHYTAPTVIAYNSEQFGFVYRDVDQSLNESIKFYSSAVFGNFNQYSKKSFAIHCCAGSWVEKGFKEKFKDFLKQNLFTRNLYRRYEIIKQSKVMEHLE
jgi:hypothetical protein